MQKPRAFHVADLGESVYHLIEIVPVHRAEVPETQGLEKVSAGFLDKPGLEAADPALQKMPEGPVSQKVPYPGFEAVVGRTGGELQKVVVQGSGVVVYGLVVVVQNHQYVGTAGSGVVQPLERKASCHRSVPDHGYAPASVAEAFCGFGVSQGC